MACAAHASAGVHTKRTGSSTELHLAVDAIVNVCGPDAREEQQHLEGQEVRRDEEQGHAVRERLQQQQSYKIPHQVCHQSQACA